MPVQQPQGPGAASRRPATDIPVMGAPVALVTGASGTQGAAFARLLAAKGYTLVLVGRNREPLQALANDIVARHGRRVHVVVADLKSPLAVDRVLESVKAHSFDIHLLINNAGFGRAGAHVGGLPEDDFGMIELNITALTRLTRRLLPAMIARGRGQILNVASVAGFLPAPYMAVYAATKAYVLSYSEALALELAGTGVHVTALCPDPVTSETRGAHRDEPVVRASSGPGLLPLAARRIATPDARTAQMSSTGTEEHHAEGVAAFAWRALERRRTVAIQGWGNRLQLWLARQWLPRSLVLRRVARRLRSS